MQSMQVGLLGKMLCVWPEVDFTSSGDRGGRERVGEASYQMVHDDTGRMLKLKLKLKLNWQW